ncbi:MAG: hypothetical protein AAF242_20985 [Bacteroidota bacterium]
MTQASQGAIRKIQGSYDPIVKDSNGQRRSLVDMLIEQVEQNGGARQVAENLMISYTRTIRNDGDAYLYGIGQTPEAILQVPTLEDLGFAEGNYTLQVMAIGYFRANSNDVPCTLRLVNEGGQLISGSESQGRVFSSNIDTPIKTAKATVVGGSTLALDFKRSSGGDEITLYQTTLLIQVIRV